MVAFSSSFDILLANDLKKLSPDCGSCGGGIGVAVGIDCGSKCDVLMVVVITALSGFNAGAVDVDGGRVALGITFFVDLLVVCVTVECTVFCGIEVEVVAAVALGFSLGFGVSGVL